MFSTTVINTGTHSAETAATTLFLGKRILND